MKLKVISILSLYASAMLCLGQGGGLWTLQPGVTTRGEAPKTWTLDLRGKTPSQAALEARRLSSRLYGSSEGALHRPLVIKSDFAEPKIFGLHLAAVSVGGGELVIKTNNVVYHRRSWPAASSTHRPNVVFHLPLPAGAVDVALEAPRGPVIVDHYFVAEDVKQLPGNLAKMAFTAPGPLPEPPPFSGDVSRKDDGYRGIWFTLGQFYEHGDKYSGGLGTYTANHIPLAVYAPEVNKTFFVYGGTLQDRRHLLIMASYYDHEKHRVPRPTIVHDKRGVNDPHDNPSMCIDGDGHIWVFISGRGRGRPGFKYRSVRPHDVSEFEFIAEQEFTYPQPWFVPGRGFFHLITKYTRGRELYWETSEDGMTWSEDKKLAGIRGHYQVSNHRDGRIATFFNRHPGGSVDRRTDLYYLQTTDFGKTWTTAGGTPVTVPLEGEDNPARVINYSEQGRLMYTIDLNFDRNGHPILLYITSQGHKPGPENEPREWIITRWTGTEWESHFVTRSDHNYDLGGLYIMEDEWRIIGPTEIGPQKWGTGGEIALWSSRDEGRTWTKKRQITRGSEFNHAYARRPVHAKDPFFSFWADGNPDEASVSRLYFGNSDGTKYWQLPYDMEGEFATPILMTQ